VCDTQSAKKWKDDVDDKVKLPNGDHLPVVLVVNKIDLLGNVHNTNESEIDEFAKARTPRTLSHAHRSPVCVCAYVRII
jgi:hypothetical protein